MKNNNDDSLAHTLKEMFESVLGSPPQENYPSEALPVGTFARSVKYDRLGVITDAYYGDLDKNGQKIIIYTLFLFPPISLLKKSHKNSEQYYMCNEYEYDIIAYLMVPPISLENLTVQLGGTYF